VFTPGEVAAAGYTGYLTERALTGMIAAEVGAAILVIERKRSRLRMIHSRVTRTKWVFRSILGQFQPV
jgi:hypothetical protein